MGEFKVGEKVCWKSQAQGTWKEKSGEVVFVVPPKTRPPGIREPGLYRDSESYIVKANGRRYWPRVSALNRAGRSEIDSLRARLALAEDAMMAADCMGNWMLVSPKKWQRKLSIDYRAKAEAFRRAEK